MKAPTPTTFPPGGEQAGDTDPVLCDKCGEKATHGYEGNREWVDFCRSCFREFGEWLESQ